MRLSEATGLHIDDIKLDCEIPHIDLKPHAWRTLKTKGSQRQIPLVGASLWAVRRVQETNTASPYAFPKYTSARGTNGNSASAAINKWLKPRVPKGLCCSLIQTLIKRQAQSGPMSIRHDRPDRRMGYCWCRARLW